ncbi:MULTISPECIES: LacI family DNA-binding transcriptional regulator [Actinomyces]|uniref:LacI family transcriptional regulator n=1 Tax=Actinomyces ruminis TaxID=1937003 RepID=A0ABX4MBE9_9ACTO|nr:MULTISPECIES: LacI family DNA-binding transcriptional regulator [Actinomyces]PHP52651.1 LacI family transcriptional regulator [Actinomyces ruminis]
MSQRVTIASIARQAGVSVPTVSKVLNGRPGVSETTRREVEALASALGYKPRHTTRPAPSHLVDFVISGLDTQWASALLTGAQAEAARRGKDLVVTATHGSPVGGAHWVDHLVTRGSAGVVVVVSELLEVTERKMRQLKMPVVLLNPSGHQHRDIPTVAATDWAGSRDATEHLVSLGHRRIAYITGPMDLVSHQDRLDAYRSVLSRHQIPYDPELVVTGNSLFEGGYRLTPRLLALDNPPTAILNGSDEQAYGSYRAIKDAGLAIPEDISVIGFDDVDLCQWVSPPMTTVHQPLIEMAQEATRMVIDLSEDPHAPAQNIELATTLVVRSSTGPAPRH